MELLTLQIFATIMSLAGAVCFIFKKKIGWIFGIVAMPIFALINYLIALYVLIIPSIASLIINIIGYTRWRREEKKK